MEVLFLERTRQPDSPTSFMTTLLRAQMPDKYGPARRSTPSRDNHCDHDRGDDQDSEHTPAPSNNNNQPSLADIQRQLEQLQHLTDKAHPNLSPHGGETQRGGAPTPNDASDLSPTDQTTRRGRFQTCPCSLPNHGRDHTSRSLPHRRGTRRDTVSNIPNVLSPTGDETQRGGAPTPNDAPDLSPTDQAPVRAGFKPALVPSPTTEETQKEGTPQLPAPTTQHPSGLTRRQRRELQRQTQAQPPKIPPPPRPQLNHTHGPFTLSLSKGRSAVHRSPTVPPKNHVSPSFRRKPESRENVTPKTQNPTPKTPASPAGHPNTPYSLRNTFLFPLFFLPHAIP